MYTIDNRSADNTTLGRVRMKFASRTFGLILMAGTVASLLVAFVGATSASAATTLCNADEESCSNATTSVHQVSVGKAKLLTSVGTTECNVLFSSTKVGAGGGTIQTVTGNFTYTECLLGGSSCTAKEENGPTEIKIEKTVSEEAGVTGEGLVHLVCSSFIDCSYNGVGLKGTFKGPLASAQTPDNGEVTLSEQSTTKEAGGLLCPKTAKLDITTSPLAAIYLGGGGGELSSTSTSIATTLKGGGKEGAEISVTEGSKVKDTATLSGENASTAGGTLTYKVYKDKECKTLATEAGKVTVKEGKVPDSEEKELEAGKEYFWQAEYSGDEMNQKSTSTCGKEVLKVKAKVSISTTLSGGGKEGAEISVTVGSKVKDTATLSGTNVSSATGTVDYSVYKDKECKELSTAAGSGKVEGSKAASSEEKELAAGTYYWQAKYLGDTLHEESASTCGGEVEKVEKFEPHKTALCTADDSGKVCVEEHKPATVEFKDSATEFLTSLLNTKCESSFSGSVGAAGEPQVVTGAKYKFSGCTSGCVITEVSGGSELKFLFETSENSTEELGSATTGKLEIFFKCGETVKCAYGPISAVGHVLGPLKTGDNGHITFSKNSLGKGEGLLCPTEASLDALFVASSATYIRENYGPTSLCSKDEKSPVCKSENQLKTIDYKASALELLTNLTNVKCEGLASGSVGEPGSTLEVKPELTFSNCGGGCFVTVVSGPGKVVLERLKSEEAKATAEGFEIFVKCGTTIKCLLGPEKMAGTALGALTTGDNGHLAFSKASMGKGEGATCPTEATLDATYIASSATYIG
jgi:hypothetical protein